MLATSSRVPLAAALPLQHLSCIGKESRELQKAGKRRVLAAFEGGWKELGRQTRKKTPHHHTQQQIKSNQDEDNRMRCRMGRAIGHQGQEKSRPGRKRAGSQKALHQNGKKYLNIDTYFLSVTSP